MSKDTFFSEKMKLADLIIEHPNLLFLLPRFGIALGFGDHNVAEVCRQYGISPACFLLICKVYSDDNFLPHRNDLYAVNMKDLFSYLRTSHRYYLETRIPNIERLLTAVVRSCQARYGNMLQRFFEDYKTEVIHHFDYEEKTVFPYIEQLIGNRHPKDFSIDQFKHNHSNVEDTLSDLMNIVIKYLPDDIDQENRIAISLAIIELSNDLNRHTLIEDRVLIPYVELLENARP